MANGPISFYGNVPSSGAVPVSAAPVYAAPLSGGGGSVSRKKKKHSIFGTAAGFLADTVPVFAGLRRLDIGHNLLSDIGDLRHVPAGMLSQGQMGLADTFHALGVADGFVENTHNKFGVEGNWAFDDVVGNIIEDYKYVYRPAIMDGDFKTTWDRIQEHPLGPILDIATILTLGAGTVAKGTQLAARSAMLSELMGPERAAAMLGKVSGLERVPYRSMVGKEWDANTGEFVTSGRDVFERDYKSILHGPMDEDRPGWTVSVDGSEPYRIVKPEEIQARVNAGVSRYKRGVTADAKSDGKLYHPDEADPDLPALYMPKRVERKYSGGTRSTTTHAYNNPIKRYIREQLQYELGAQPVFQNMPGGNRRAAKREEIRKSGRLERILKKEFLDSDGPIRDAFGISPVIESVLRSGWGHLTGGSSIDDKKNFYQRQLDKITEAEKEVSDLADKHASITAEIRERKFAMKNRRTEAENAGTQIPLTAERAAADEIEALKVKAKHAKEKFVEAQKALANRSKNSSRRRKWLSNVVHRSSDGGLRIAGVDENNVVRTQLDNIADESATKLTYYGNLVSEKLAIEKQIIEHENAIEHLKHENDVDLPKKSTPRGRVHQDAAEFEINQIKVDLERATLRLKEINKELASPGLWDNIEEWNFFVDLREKFNSGVHDARSIRHMLTEAIDDSDLFSDYELHKNTLIARIEELSNPILKAIEAKLQGKDIDTPEEIADLLSDENVNVIREAMKHWQIVSDKANEILQQVFSPDPEGHKIDGADPNKKRPSSAAVRLREEMEKPEADRDQDKIDLLEEMVDRAINPKKHGTMEEASFSERPLDDPRVHIAERQKAMGLKETGYDFKSYKIKPKESVSPEKERGIYGRKQKPTQYYTLRQALDATDYDSLHRAQMEAVAAQVARHRLHRLSTHTRNVPIDSPTPRGYRVLSVGNGNDHITRAAKDILDKLNNEVAIVFDPDETPYINDVVDFFESVINAKDTEKVIVPNDMYREIVKEIGNAEKFLHTFIEQPQRFWRSTTLGYRPAWVTNQAIGNIFLLYTTHGLFKATRELLNYATSRGRAEMAFMQRELDSRAPDLMTGGITESLIGKKFEESDSYASALTHGAFNAAGKYEKFMKGKFGPETMMRFIARHVDDPGRRLAFMAGIRKPARDLMKRMEERGTPISFRQAAETLLSDDEFFDHMVQETLDDMINFRDMSEIERRWIRPFIPFYSWISGISRRTVRMLMENPAQANLFYIEGREGRQYMNDVYGDVQDFLLDYFPLNDPKHADKAIALKTAGINPMNTVVDLAGAVRALTGGGDWKGSENPLSMINPYMKAALETATGKDFFYNNTIEEYRPAQYENGVVKGGDPDAAKTDVFLGRLGKGFPAADLIYNTWFAPEYPNDQTPGKKYNWISYAGVPIAAVNAREAAKRGREETYREIRKDIARERIARLEAANG